MIRHSPRSVHTPIERERAVELDATRELQSAIGLIELYAALLEAQLAVYPSLSSLRPGVGEVRAQAILVARVVERALEAGLGSSSRAGRAGQTV